MAAKIDKTKTTAFLAELTELSRKHGVVIEGCGCCESPYLIPQVVDEAFYHIDRNGHVYLTTQKHVEEWDWLDNPEDWDGD